MDDVERTLWDRWRLRRDDGAFEALVAPHLRFAAAFARRLGLAEADADDVVQQSLVRLSAETGERPARVGLRAWLGREVLQAARMSFRAARRREVHEHNASPVGGAEPASPLEVHDEVERALLALDEKGRRAVELRFLHDLEYREIAHVLAISTLACRLRVHRALARLRQRLGPNASMRVAALPMLGLTTRWRSLAEGIAGGHAATAAVAGGVLLMGVSTKVAVVAVVLVGGLGVWYAWPDPPPSREKPEMPVIAAASEGARLEGRADRPAASLSATAPTATPAPTIVRASGPPLDTPIPPGKGSVSGRLTFTDGSPARGVRLALSGYTLIDAVTDADGRFHIHGEWVASRTLHVAGPLRYQLGLTVVQLVADKRVEVDVAIERGVALEGVLMAEVTRKPLPGVLVTLRRPGANVSNMPQGGYGWVETDEAGQFRFDLLPPAAYTLEVDNAVGMEARVFPFDLRGDERREFLLRAARQIRVRLENVSEAAKGKMIGWEWERGDFDATGRIRPSGKSPIDARGELRIAAPPPGRWTLSLRGGEALPPVSQSNVLVGEGTPEELVLRVPAGVPVDGVLRDSAGLPVAGIPLMASGDAKAKTDADGRFTMPLVAAGPTRFWIVEEGMSSFVGAAEVPATGRGRVDLVLPGRGTVKFRVVYEGDLSGGVASLTVPGAPLGTHTQAWPDSRGEYRFRFLAPGTYELWVLAGSLPPHREEITLKADEERDLGEVRFAEPIDVPVEMLVPTGTKLPPLIYVSAAPIGEHGRIHTAVPAQIVVALDGTARLRGLAPGTYRLTVMLDGFKLEEHAAVEIRGPRPDTLRIELRPNR